MKKRLSALLATVLALVLCCSTALAAQYELEAVDATAQVPGEGYYVFHTNMAQDDPALALLEMSAEEVKQAFEASGILLDILPADMMYEIMVQVQDDEWAQSVVNCNYLGQLEKTAALSAIGTALEQEGYAVNALAWQQAGQASWIVSELVIPEDGSWVYQYQTIYNSRLISVLCFPLYEMELTDELRTQVADLAGSVSFGHTDPAPADGPSISLDDLPDDVMDSVLGELPFTVGEDVLALLEGDPQAIGTLLSKTLVGIGAGAGAVLVVFVIVLVVGSRGRKKKAAAAAVEE